MTNRRQILLGLAGFVACAPAIVRASSLMKLPRRPLEWWERPCAVQPWTQMGADEIRSDILEGIVAIQREVHAAFVIPSHMLVSRSLFQKAARAGMDTSRLAIIEELEP